MGIKKVFYLFVTVVTCCSCKKDKNNDNGSDEPVFNATVTTVAGTKGAAGHTDGVGDAARFMGPEKMVWDGRDQCLYIVDDPVTIRKMDAQNNVSTYLNAGGGVIGVFNDITDISLAPGVAGSLYITTARALYKVEPNGNSATVTPMINNGPGNQVGPFSQAQLEVAYGVALGKDGKIVFFNGAWNTMHSAVLNTSTDGAVNTFAGKPLTASQGTSWPYQDGQGESATFSGRVYDITSDGNGNIYVADYDNNLVRMVTPGGAVSSLFKYASYASAFDVDGQVTTATSNRVYNVGASKDGSYVFFTSFGPYNTNQSNTALRLIRPGKDVTTIAGGNVGYKDGTGKEAAFGGMDGIAVTDDGKTIFIAESGNKVIRKVVLK